MKICNFAAYYIYYLHIQRLKSVKIKEVTKALERFAPLPLQESWDNAGLQVGLTEAEVSGALLCLDVTCQIVDEAIQKGCNLIVSHHPLIFRKLARLTGEDYVQQAVMKAIANGIVIMSMHTNMDNAQGGVNFKIAEKMGLHNVRFMSAKTIDGVECGSGVIGEFEEPIAADDFIILLKKAFCVECVEANQLLRRPIKKVAMCGGSGSFLLDEAVDAGADAFLTGEMHYHEYFGREQQIQIAVIGHYQSEQYTSEIFRDIIERECQGVKCFIAETCTNPIMYF